MALSVHIRCLSIADLESCLVVESATFPPAEAASREKIEYRLVTCPELCYGLFLDSRSTAPSEAADVPQSATASTNASHQNARLIAHVLSTRSLSVVVTDQDMQLPANWRDNPQDGAKVGHQPNGNTVALHSLAMCPSHQKLGLGKYLMSRYIEKMREMQAVERISILTYENLVSFYQELGFQLLGASASTHGGVAWKDMVYTIDTKTG
ncbi:hypothetical protein E4U33_000124 [Claviceps sp. LM78 group G4]|nr:hypothetical protein E4U33_000124 [Claviceps sp. LM78 group G4]